MSAGLRLCVVGAGSSYTPELVEGIAARPPERLPLTELRLHDVEPSRLEVMAGLARRMLAASGRALTVTHGTELPRMLDGADFVITQIRVGGMAARHIDETVPLKYGIVGQETTGPGGMFKALRTIPAMLELAGAVEAYAPGAFVLNYTNPSGMVTEAVSRHSRVKIIGLCSGIPGMQADLARRLAPVYPDLKTYAVGLNHLGFIHRMLSGGRDVTADCLARLRREDGGQEPSLAELLGALPIGYTDYFYRRAHKLEDARRATRTRAQQIMEIEAEIFREAALPSCAARPQALARRGGGGYAEIAFSFLEALLRGRDEELVCSVSSRGCVDGVDPDAAVELTCAVGPQGARPLPVGRLPLAFGGLVHAVKAYESLAVEAAVKREKRLVILALLNHPLCGDLDVARPLAEDMLRVHGLDYR